MFAELLQDHDDTPIEDKIVVLNGLSWSDYQRLLEIRGEAYNLTNTPHFANPQANLNAGAFGEISSLNNGLDSLGRQINLALRLLF